MEKLIAFCDESGNSGVNYWDPQDPFFVMAAWIVPETISKTDFVQQTLSKHDLLADLRGRRRGNAATLPRISRAFREFGKNGCVPGFIMAEKRFAVCGKIINVLLEPEHNPEMASDFLFNRSLHQTLVEDFYSLLSDDTLKKFTEAYLSEDIVQMEAFISAACAECEAAERVDLPRMLRGSVKHLHENTDFLTQKLLGFSRNHQSINMVIVGSFFSMLEQLARKINAEFSIVHDEIYHYERAYSSFFTLSKQRNNPEFLTDDGNTFITNLNRIKDFKFANSESNLWVKTADMLALGINRCAKHLLLNETMTPELTEIMSLTFPALLIGEITTAISICSGRTVKRFAPAFHALLRSGSP